jgi:RNA polymerase sigma-70 factor (ECF subfamily)
MDDQTLCLLQEGDESAYKELFITYYSPLCEYATRYIPDEDAEELVQDLMLHIWESRDTLIIESSIKNYLFTAVRHQCLNAIKKKLYHKRVHHILYEKLKEQFEDPDYYMINELSDMVEKAIRELPDNYRIVFELSRFNECPNAQIAKQLGLSIKTIEYRISQSLKILRIKLKDYLPLLAFLFKIGL